jgi:deoxyinosine 3'endonuclease (endonuclease V)
MTGREIPAGFRFCEAGPGNAAGLLVLKRSLDRETSFMLLEPDERTEDEQDIAADLAAIAAADNSVVMLAEADGRLDGYADLDPAGSPGLGAHAHAEFGVPVIGVAKTAFRTATHAVPVVRGGSARPLFVTAAGMSADEAAALVAGMAGRFRLPDALRRADALARTGRPAQRQGPGAG